MAHFDVTEDDRAAFARDGAVCIRALFSPAEIEMAARGIDPLARDASLEFIAGSHLGPWHMPRTFLDRQARFFPEGTLEELPDIEADRAASPIITWALEPGDAIFFICSRCTVPRE
jgi:ectoine hydroxylase-related dioxygenase (phytanoyl-CoA dioxygenase family)